MSTPLLIGTSGWNYREWKDGFYAQVRQKDWLVHYANHFATVEVNATFYRLQTKGTLERWAEQTPKDFVFAVKGSRYLTHTKRLKGPREAVEKQRENLLPLSEKCWAVLWQLPARMERELARLEDFVRALKSWSEVDHVFEPRNSTWFDDQVAAVLREARVGVCISDAADWPMWEEVTSQTVYVRLHGHEETYRSRYGEKGLRPWAKRIRSWLEQGLRVYVYFDNTDSGAAVDDAHLLQGLMEEDQLGLGG